MGPKFIGALVRWLINGCRNNFFTNELNDADKENVDLFIGIVISLLLLGGALLLIKYDIW